MRILLLSQWFTPEPTFKGVGFARALRARGHHVQVLTGFPNYPGGKLYPGYKVQPHTLEVLDGIPVHRVPLYPSHDSGRLGRLANYASFALSAAILGPALIEPADVAYVYHPPITIGIPALSLKMLRGIPFVLDIQDLWPDTLAATNMVSNKAVLGATGRFCSAIYRSASRLVVLSPGFKSVLVSRGVPEDKIEVIYNWCDGDVASPAPSSRKLADGIDWEGRFNIIFAGTMGKAQDLDTVLRAAALLQADTPQVQFVLIGGGVEVKRLRAAAEEMALTNVQFLPRVPMREIGAILSSAEALLIHLRADPLFEITIPSKTQAYLAAGRPILMGVNGDARNLLREAGAGICFEPGDAEGLAASTRLLVNMSQEDRERLGLNGRAYYVNNLSLDIGVSRFELLLDEVATGG
ncbi:glycosyltransferase family 4 protein [Gemmatimonadota bacterium]